MRVTLSRSGGFAGIRPPPVIVDTASLPPAQARRVEALVTGANFFELPEVISAPDPQPDRFQYTLSVTDNAGNTHAVTVDEQAAPGPVLDLILLVRGARRA